MTDAIVPNPTWLQGLQSLDVAELATARQLLIPKPSIWRLADAPAYTPTRTGWAPLGLDGGSMSIEQDEPGNLQSRPGFFVYVAPETAYYRYDFQMNCSAAAAAGQPTIGLALADVNVPFSPLVTVPFMVASPNPFSSEWSLSVSGEFLSPQGEGYCPVFFQGTSSSMTISTSNFSMREIVT